jgi:hypothetical protein
MKNPFKERLNHGSLHPILMQEKITLKSNFPTIQRMGLVIKDEIISLFPNVPGSTRKNFHKAWSSECSSGNNNSIRNW